MQGQQQQELTKETLADIREMITVECLQWYARMKMGQPLAVFVKRLEQLRTFRFDGERDLDVRNFEAAMKVLAGENTEAPSGDGLSVLAGWGACDEEQIEDAN